MILYAGDSVDGSCLNDGTVPDLSQIEIRLGFACFLEVVVQRGVEDGELDSNIVQVLVGCLERVLPIFSATKDIVGL